MFKLACKGVAKTDMVGVDQCSIGPIGNGSVIDNMLQT